MWFAASCSVLGLLTVIIAVGAYVGITDDSNRAQAQAAATTNNAPPTATASPTVSVVPSVQPSAAPTVDPFLWSLPNYTLDAIGSSSSVPQYLAYQWVSSEDQPPFFPEEKRMEKKTQRFALATLYYATRGSVWPSNSGWLNFASHECDWFGCNCTTDGTRIKSLRLSKTSLMARFRLN